MNVSDLLVGRGYAPLEQQRIQSGVTAPPNDASFVNTLKEFIGDTNTLQKESSAMTDKLIKGEPVDLHDVMISAEKAKTTFQLLLELRNKALDMYREVDRIQV
ncbi:MAG: flagellar hook-basal body complex protein FliE [Ignavibacteriae bacterium]|nr:flagellar hook-basal body complex protein FliE [Ignavibacteriota bacterium]